MWPWIASRRARNDAEGPVVDCVRFLRSLSASLRGALATTASAEARRAKAEAIQSVRVSLDCFAQQDAHSCALLARNDVEAATETLEFVIAGSTCDEASERRAWW
jgi:hypothetical protein